MKSFVDSVKAAMIIGEMIVSQTEDYTCLHCGTLQGVYVCHDDDSSQEWFCSICAGLCLVTKLGGTLQKVERGRHGTNRNQSGEDPCCFPLSESISTQIRKPTKVRKQTKSALRERVGVSNFNEGIFREGERLSALFLSKNNLTFEKGFPLEGKNIDFLVHSHGGDILWENADLTETNLERGFYRAGVETFLRFKELFTKKEIRQFEEKLEVWDKQKVVAKAGGCWDPNERIWDIVQAKSEQLKGASEKYPVILALYNESPMQFAKDLNMRIGLAHDKYFKKDKYHFFSAIAVLDNQDDDVTVRLYHNEYAEKPLARGIFPVGVLELDKTNVDDEPMF